MNVRKRGDEAKQTHTMASAPANTVFLLRCDAGTATLLRLQKECCDFVCMYVCMYVCM